MSSIKQMVASSNIQETRQFPMFVVPIKHFLTMSIIEMHEDLRAQGILVEYVTGSGPVIFMSHTWYSTAHPDPHSRKLRLLQNLLKQAALKKLSVPAYWQESLHFGLKFVPAGQMQAHVKDGYVWIDFQSVPQQDGESQMKAIASIPSYVANSRIFVCIAPAAYHENGTPRDYRAWMGRGWCRTECAANALSPTPKQMIVAESPSSVYLKTGWDWMIRPVGKGSFTVDADKASIGPVLRLLIDQKRQSWIL